MPEALQYEPLPGKNRRPRWVYVVISVYLLFIVTLLALPTLAALDAGSDQPGLAFAKVALAVGVLLLLAGSLLFIPVREHRRRPIRRRAIWIPLIGSSLLIAALAAGATGAAMEYFKTEEAVAAPIAAIAGVWVCWLTVFGLMARSTNPISLSSRIYKTVFAGSLLELLIAVPMHIAVRRRSECCAGIMTAIAICTGAVITIVALGPAVFVLYRKRWDEVYRRNDSTKTRHDKR